MTATAPSAPRAQSASLAPFTRHFIAYGVPFHLRALDAQGLTAMRDLLPVGTEIGESAAADTPCFTLPPEAHPEFPSLLQRLEQQLLLHVAVHAPHYIFLHAGVVGWQGGTIVFPGASHAGKSTLVAELLKLGALYYSDEYALLDSAGKVHPYPRDLRMRAPGSSHQTSVSPASLSGKVATAPAVVTHVVFTEFVPGAAWSPQLFTGGMAILGMMPHCISARRHPSEAIRTLKAVMRTAQASRTARGNANATARALLQALDSAGSAA